MLCFAAVEISQTISMTAEILEGDAVYIFPIPTNRPKDPTCPCLLDIQEASTICLIEVSSSSSLPAKGDSAKWLNLYLRELLGMYYLRSFVRLNHLYRPVDIQFVTRYQTLQVKFQGQTRTFQVLSGLSATKPSPGLESELKRLTLDSSAKSASFARSVWTVGWDTNVSLESPSKTPAHKVGLRTCSTGKYQS